MVGTAGDFLMLLEALRTGGGPILKREIVAMALENQIGEFSTWDAGGKFGFLSGSGRPGSGQQSAGSRNLASGWQLWPFLVR